MKTPDPEASSEGMQPPLPLSELIAATITAFAMCRLPSPHFMSWSQLLASATERVFAVFLVAILSNVGLYRTKEACGASHWHFPLRTALCAIWLAPLALFISEDSAWALPITATLIVGIDTSFRLLPNASDNEIPSLVDAYETSSFSLLESPHPFKQFFAVGAALCAEAGALATLGGHLFSGTLLVAISSAGWVYAIKHPSPRTSDESFRSRSRAPIAFALAILFTAAGLMPHLGGGHEFGGSGISGKHRVGARSEEARYDKAAQEPLEGSAAQDAYAGIVLWPKPCCSRTDSWQQHKCGAQNSVDHSVRGGLLVLQGSRPAPAKETSRGPWHPGGVQHPRNGSARALDGSTPEPRHAG